MLFKIIAVGKLKDRALESHVGNFIQRLSPFAKVEIQEVRDSNSKNEGEKIISLLENEKGYVIVLSEDGKEMTSTEFASMLSQIDRKVVLVIGGPYGLTDQVKKRADLLMALSQMTFTHEIARFILSEQLYRAVMIIKGKKYHN